MQASSGERERSERLVVEPLGIVDDTQQRASDGRHRRAATTSPTRRGTGSPGHPAPVRTPTRSRSVGAAAVPHAVPRTATATDAPPRTPCPAPLRTRRRAALGSRSRPPPRTPASSSCRYPSPQRAPVSRSPLDAPRREPGSTPPAPKPARSPTRSDTRRSTTPTPGDKHLLRHGARCATRTATDVMTRYHVSTITRPRRSNASEAATRALADRR